MKLPDLKSPAPEAKMQPEAKVQPPPALTSSKVQPEAKVQPSPAVTSSKVQPEAEVQPSPASPAVTSSTFEEAMIEASKTAAQLIADAESKAFLTDKTVREMEKLDRMAEQNDAMLKLSEELLKKCNADKQPYISIHLLINTFSYHILTSKMTIVLFWSIDGRFGWCDIQLGLSWYMLCRQ